mmetsp:Transcript_26397/g.37161  ORF Transcript_26397/g.37161 Transcript_26397/m.37161 type:complete len:183 (-) Transcript_26397:58-606(-)
MSLICGACNEQITSVSLDAFGMTFHPTCLVCNVCGKDFSDGSVLQEGQDGYAYCAKDFVNTFCPKCATCGEGIQGQVITALDRSYHPEHFVCSTCKVVLSGQFFAGPNGTPFCEKHYYESQGLLCPECEKPILSGKCIPFLDKKYHPEHFKCNYCKKNLVGQPYQKQNNKPYCKQCHLSLFG